MSKYIVKNCPAITDGRNIQNICTNLNACCELITNCLIKQVIEKCREIECPCEFNGADCWECSTAGQKTLAEQILQLFEIEECE